MQHDRTYALETRFKGPFPPEASRAASQVATADHWKPQPRSASVEKVQAQHQHTVTCAQMFSPWHQPFNILMSVLHAAPAKLLLVHTHMVISLHMVMLLNPI